MMHWDMCKTYSWCSNYEWAWHTSDSRKRQTSIIRYICLFFSVEGMQLSDWSVQLWSWLQITYWPWSEVCANSNEGLRWLVVSLCYLSFYRRRSHLILYELKVQLYSVKSIALGHSHARTIYHERSHSSLGTEFMMWSTICRHARANVWLILSSIHT